MKEILNKRLSSRWNIPFAIMLGILFGLGFLSFYLSNASSYITDDPKACINCHIMKPEYSTWQHSSHREHTTCNDCHVPQNNIVRKYFFKASDGMRHAFMFTFKLDPQIIQINSAGRTVVQENCLRCHIRQVNPVSITNVTGNNYQHGVGKLCWDCHRHVPHGTIHSRAVTHFSSTTKK
jgi:cytochrome c nitrite reductase small subunit